MADVENTIKGLYTIGDFVINNLSYDKAKKHILTIENAISLLEMQEGKLVHIVYTDPENFRGAYCICPECKGNLRYYTKEITNYCPMCGQKIIWINE